MNADPGSSGPPGSRDALPETVGGAIGLRTVALLGVAVAAVSFAAILVRIAEAPALAIAFWRNALGAAVLAPLALRSGFRPTAAQARGLLASGTALAVHFALFIGSLSLTTVASAVVLVSTSPAVVGLIAFARRSEAPTTRGWLGILLACGGAGAVALLDRASGTAPSPLVGDVMAAGGAVAVAAYLVIGRGLRQRLPVAVYAAWVYGIAAAVLLAACLVTATPLGLSPVWPASTWWAIGGLVVGPQLLGHTIFNTVLDRVSAAVVALVTLLEPVGSALLAIALLAEWPTAGFYVGAPLILAGVYVGTVGSPGVTDASPPT